MKNHSIQPMNLSRLLDVSLVQGTDQFLRESNLGYMILESILLRRHFLFDEVILVAPFVYEQMLQ